MSYPAVSYVDPPDIPAGMTLGEYRRSRVRPRRRRRQRLLRPALRGLAGRAAVSRRAA